MKVLLTTTIYFLFLPCFILIGKKRVGREELQAGRIYWYISFITVFYLLGSFNVRQLSFFIGVLVTAKRRATSVLFFKYLLTYLLNYLLACSPVVFIVRNSLTFLDERMKD